jgi:hypothetical protein
MGMIILENLIPLLFALATPILLMLASGLMKAAAKKWNLESALTYEGKVVGLVLKGIKAAEKKSMSAIKKAGDKNEAKTPGEEKLAMTMEFVNNTLTANNLPEKGGKELAMLIESALFDGAKEKPAAEPATLTEG